MKNMKTFEEFWNKANDKLGKWMFGDDVKIDDVDDVDKKYTEKDVFDLTQEAYQVGYSGGEGGEKSIFGDRIKATEVANPQIMNVHKNWFKKKFNK